jgi:leucine dehydrogenase
MIEHPAFDRHEQVVFASDPASGLRAIVAIHSTAAGPAFGGCRMHSYPSDDAALGDALRLSRGMTYKAAIFGLPWGGGKSVVIGDPCRDKTPELLLALAHVIEGCGGRYVVADDVGTTLDDLRLMRSVTLHTAAATPASQRRLPVTAYGVLNAIKAAVRHRLGWDRLTGLRVAVQGLGNVGQPLCGYLHREGAKLFVADLDEARVREAVATFGAHPVAADAILEVPVEVLAPCALGSVLSATTIPRIRADIVCGGANEQLEDENADRLMHDRGILYVPDYLANAGGVIDFHQEWIDDRPEAVLHAVRRIVGVTTAILSDAATCGSTPKELADARVRARLQTDRTSPH